MYVSNFLALGADPGPKVPLAIVRCNDCTLAQLTHTVDPDVMYKEKYWYLSGTNASMRDALKDVVEDALSRVTFEAGDHWIDIGANDGTLLGFVPQNFIRVGFEPAAQFAPADVDSWVSDYFDQNDVHNQAKVITSIAMFYDLDDPNTFVADIKRVLHPDGVWIVQMSYLRSMLAQNAFDNICHEHLEYYDLTSFENLVERHGLKVIDISLNNVNGGSFRLTVMHDTHERDRPQVQRVWAMREEEQIRQFTGPEAWRLFAQRVGQIKAKTVDYITSHWSRYNLWVYGASTKGNTLLQYYGLTHDQIDYALDANPDKAGLYTVGSNIPIGAPRLYIAPQCFLVLPWHFRDNFLKREASFLDNGGTMLFPLPYPEIVYTKKVIAMESL